MEPTKRLPTESIETYKIRLCSCKTELDLTWTQIAELINAEAGTNLSADTYRKEWSFYSKGFSAGLEANISDEEMLKEIDEKKLELQREKFRFQDQKREFGNKIREMARLEHIQEELIKGMELIAQQKPLVWHDKSTKAELRTGKNEAVLLISDWHRGVAVDSFLNKFDNEEFKRRVTKLVYEVLRHCKLHGIQTIHIFILGDMVHGVIHTNARVQSTENVTKQVQNVSEILAEILAKFSDEFIDVYVYTVRGNHDRIIPSKDEAINGESFMDFIPWYLKARLANFVNIHIIEEYDLEFSQANVCGKCVVGVHGQKDKPESVISNITNALRKIPDYVVLGHYHHDEERDYNGTKVIMNGSLFGIDEFAQNNRLLGKSTQKLMIFEDTDCVCIYSIGLDK